MPKVAYSEEERKNIRNSLIEISLELMSKQGIQHTTVEQIYKKAGISRTFFYSFFPTKEDLIVETLYLQQPRIIEYVKKFLYACCYGNGIAVLSIKEQKLIFDRLSPESYEEFRRKQIRLFGDILNGFGVTADQSTVKIFTNLSLTVMIIRKAIPDNLPLFFQEAADETLDFQINAIVDLLEKMKK